MKKKMEKEEKNGKTDRKRYGSLVSGFGTPLVTPVFFLSSFLPDHPSAVSRTALRFFFNANVYFQVVLSEHRRIL